MLVLRLGALGDVLRTLPAVRLVRAGLPEAGIWWVVDDRWLAALDGHADLSGTIAFPRRMGNLALRRPARWPALVRELRAFRRRLRGIAAHLVLDFHGNLRSGVVGVLSGAPVRLGYEGHQQKEANRWLTTHRVASGDRRTPRMARNLDLVRALGLPDAPPPRAEPALVGAGSEAATAILAAAGLAAAGFGVLNPGASAAQAYKKPPAALLAAAARQLDTRGLVPLVVWGPGEEPDARRVVELAGGRSLLAPPTDLAALAALLARARLFVGGDSGPLHLACAVGCPVVGLYGPTDPVVNGPWGVPCRALFPEGRAYTGIKRHDRHGGGFDGLAPDGVAAAVAALLDEIG